MPVRNEFSRHVEPPYVKLRAEPLYVEIRVDPLYIEIRVDPRIKPYIRLLYAEPLYNIIIFN